MIDGQPVDAVRGRWPVALRGITESIVATRRPDGDWNLAALGLRVGDGAVDPGDDATADGTDEADAGAHPRSGPPAGGAQRPVTARTWGRTRTRRNLERTGVCVVQFTRDPVAFVEAALDVVTAADPVLESADAWVAVSAERTARDVEDAGGDGDGDDTRIDEWTLMPLAATVRRQVVPTTSRGPAAVIEATVAASRLDVPGYDDDRLRRRLRYFAAVARRCGGAPERRAIDCLAALLDDDLDLDAPPAAPPGSGWPRPVADPEDAAAADADGLRDRRSDGA